MCEISILIANYNNGIFFKDCYQSIIKQTFKSWEVIIVDDASTDNSLEIIKDLIKDDSRFRLYENPSNKGCGFTKKRCMDYAKGKICAYLDPDDALYPTALELSVKEYDNKDIVATYSHMMLCDENLVPQETFKGTKQIYNNRYFFNCPIQFAHFFTFKREIYLQTEGIDTNLQSAVDQDLYLKILDHGNPAFINKDLYLYRLHSKGISQQSSKQSAKESFAKVIHAAMKRRGIKSINNRKVPEEYKKPEDIFKLLEYQAKPLYRLISKIKLKLLS